jgi:hypothetical protein
VSVWASAGAAESRTRHAAAGNAERSAPARK